MANQKIKCPNCGSTEVFKDEERHNLYWCEKCGFGFGLKGTNLLGAERTHK